MARPESRAPVERVVYTVTDFCTAHGISRWLYYKMKKDGTGPREMRIGDRAFITIESATKWRRAQERKNNLKIGNADARLGA
jgi:predicted DNA-binding transcriptional regulator AlpA